MNKRIAKKKRKKRLYAEALRRLKDPKTSFVPAEELIAYFQQKARKNEKGYMRSISMQGL